MFCKVCSSRTQKVLDLPQSQQVTSLGRLIAGQAAIFRCEFCTHCQTETTINLAEYYAKEYKTLMHTMEEDDVYRIVKTLTIYRAEHMAQTFIKKISDLINFSTCEQIRFLDFGTGKGLFPRTVTSLNPILNPYLYDVSDDYTISWGKFCNSDHYSCFTIPADWNRSFDIVTSMFSLEHVVNPLSELRLIANLLKPGGYLYIVVPNMYSENIFDMVVVDHVQHYSPSSMRVMLEQVGLMLVSEDHVSHDQASIYIAHNIINTSTDGVNNCGKEMYLSRQDEISHLFSNMSCKISDFADSTQDNSIVVIGAGVIGTFVKSVLDGRHSIDLFVDSNIYKQSKGWLSIPVISPSDLVNYDRSNNPHYIIAHNSKMIPLALDMLPKDVPSDKILKLF